MNSSTEGIPASLLANLRPNPLRPSSRLELRIDHRLNQQLEDLADALGHGAQKADVIRRALALYVLAKQKELEGATLQFNNNGDIETVINI